MENWNEIRTAYQVARLGTVSAAADFLGVHRATVIRHINTLEEFLGTKLFQRHSQGYQATEAGLDLMRTAKITEEQFDKLVARTKGGGQELSGDFVVTSLNIVAPMIMPVLKTFQDQHPKILVRYIVSDQLFQLEYGEAHVAIRTGAQPEVPDIFSEHFTLLKMGLYASQEYTQHQGIPKTYEDFAQHSFVGFDNPHLKSPINIWMRNKVAEDNIIFHSNSPYVLEQAVLSGIGIGFIPQHRANQYPELVEVWQHQDEWDVKFWLLAHIDLYQTAKVQTFFKLMDAFGDVSFSAH